MGERAVLDSKAVALLAMTCGIWSLQQVGLQATSHLAAPVMQLGVRSLIAGACVYALIRIRGGHVAFSGKVAVAGAFLGVLFSIEFLLIGESLRFTSTSHVVVFMYTAPIFAALGLHWKLPSERLSAVQWLGIGLAAAGIAMTFLGRGEAPHGVDPETMLFGDLLALTAGLCWGITTIAIRTTVLSDVPAPQTLFYQLAVSGVLLVAAAAMSGQASMQPSWLLTGNIAFQAFIIATFSYLLWFWMLTKYKASQLGVFSFMTPMFGVVLGVVLLGEPLTRAFLIGAAFVLGGITLVTAYPWLRQRRKAAMSRRQIVQN